MSTAPIFKPEKRTRETWDLQRGLWDLPCGLQALTIAPRVSTLRSGRGWLPGTLLGRVCEFVRDRDGGAWRSHAALPEFSFAPWFSEATRPGVCV